MRSSATKRPPVAPMTVSKGVTAAFVVPSFDAQNTAATDEEGAKYGGNIRYIPEKQPAQ